MGVRHDTQRHRTSRTYQQVSVNDALVLHPIARKLYKDFWNESYFKEYDSISNKKGALKVQVYYDEFEARNHLGSKLTFILY